MWLNEAVPVLLPVACLLRAGALDDLDFEGDDAMLAEGSHASHDIASAASRAAAVTSGPAPEGEDMNAVCHCSLAATVRTLLLQSQ